jgi:acetamidase/formamidase
MIDYLVQVHHLDSVEAYVLCSLAGNLHVAEVEDTPHVLVSMHMSKRTLGM